MLRGRWLRTLEGPAGRFENLTQKSLNSTYSKGSKVVFKGCGAARRSVQKRPRLMNGKGGRESYFIIVKSGEKPSGHSAWGGSLRRNGPKSEKEGENSYLRTRQTNPLKRGTNWGKTCRTWGDLPQEDAWTRGLEGGRRTGNGGGETLLLLSIDNEKKVGNKGPIPYALYRHEFGGRRSSEWKQKTLSRRSHQHSLKNRYWGGGG